MNRIFQRFKTSKTIKSSVRFFPFMTLKKLKGLQNLMLKNILEMSHLKSF
jgi:hypothetical protein